MIFIDRSIPQAVASALQLVREDVEWLEPRFRHDATEQEWMEGAGTGGWLCITRDKHIRTRPGERQSLIDNGVGCFILAQKQPLTRWEYLKLIAATMDNMEDAFNNTERPFLIAVGRSGKLTRII